MYQVKVVLTDNKGKISKQHIFQSVSKANADEVFKNLEKEMCRTFNKNLKSELNISLPKSPME
jgi:hypothetical protein